MPTESSSTIAYMSASSKPAAYHHGIANGVLLMFDGKVKLMNKELDLYETNCIGSSLREDLVWNCALWQQDPSRLWYKVEGRYETVNGIRQHIKDDWVAWEPRHASFVREMSELRRKIEEAQCE